MTGAIDFLFVLQCCRLGCWVGKSCMCRFCPHPDPAVSVTILSAGMNGHRHKCDQFGIFAFLNSYGTRREVLVTWFRFLLKLFDSGFDWGFCLCQMILGFPESFTSFLEGFPWVRQIVNKLCVFVFFPCFCTNRFYLVFFCSCELFKNFFLFFQIF